MTIHPQTQTPLLYESHMHTPLCKHAVGWPGEYAEVAERRGFKGIIVTCHNPIPDGYSASVRMGMEELHDYFALVAETARDWKNRVDVRLGMECDYAPEMERWLENLVTKAEFHYLLGSIHPQVGEYRQRYFTGDHLAYQKLYFNHLAMAAETGFFDCLAHPDLIKNESPEEWDLDRILPDIQRALDRIARTGIAMELNTSGVNKRLSEVNPGFEILVEMQERAIPVVLGADAHEPARVGDLFPEAIQILAQAGYENVSFFLDRKRQDVRLDAALASLGASFTPA